MLHVCDQYFIAGLQFRAQETLRDQVDGFGGATGKNDLAFGWSVDKLRQLSASSLIQICRFLAQRVNPAVNICVVLTIKIIDCVNHCERPLRRSRSIEIDQRFATHLPLQDRKIPADAVDIESRLRFH
jgi:hypothetical protein